MKNSILNFSTPLYITLVLAFFLLTACQKEQLEINSIENISTITKETTTKIHELDLSNLEDKAYGRDRVLFNDYIETDRGFGFKLSINVEDLPNPNTHKIEAILIPFGKPTDLVVQGWNRNQPQIFNDIKESRNPDLEVDRVIFRASDFLANETNAIIDVQWQGAGNKFELKLYAIPVDCQEEAPRNQGDVGVIFQPVCGCDGRTYFDATAAYNAGITSYERGQCMPNFELPIEGLWQAIDIESPFQYLEIIKEFAKDCYILRVSDLLEDGTYEHYRFLICPEEDRTWTVVDEKKDRLSLFWPVEKWSVQVNKQGELEVFRSNGAVKDKEQYATILHRFKRIK